MKDEENTEDEPCLSLAQWDVNPKTGVITLTERTLKSLLRSEPLENLYILDTEPIARGQFAVVYHCTNRKTGKEYAAKFSSRVRVGADCSADIVHEIAVSAMLNLTPRAVHLVDVFSTDREMILVMEYAPGGDLQTLLDEDMVPYENDVIKFMRQLLESLVYIHERNIVHLDIKPQNLVLMGDFPDCAIKLCDFEISRMLSEGQEVREILGTPDYVAPEILHYEPITTRTDMWSVGVLTYVLLTGFLPFGGENDQETFVEILKCELDFPSELFEDITPEAIDFIKKLLIRKPEQRMSAKESLNHVWMRKGARRPTPPSTLNLTSSLNSHVPLGSPVTLVPNDPSIDILKKTDVNHIHPILIKSPSDNSKLPYIQIPTKDIGRPPLHPFSSQRSLVGDSSSLAGTPVSTPNASSTSPFVYRQESKLGSRHNLERMRSMSKSREVISGRVQMSNLKKCLSKSKERLCDSRLGVSKSREQLMALNSLSQSVEALSALSYLTQQNLYQSCNNIFVPKIRLPQEAGNSQERMYQSMAAIDKIDNMNCSKGIGYFESSISLNNQSYNDILTERNTNMNSLISNVQFDKPTEYKSAFGLRGNTCKGGRTGNSDTCGSRCRKQRQPEPKLTQRIPKMSKAEKIKKDAQKRRKEKKERERQERLKKEREKKEKEKHKPNTTENDSSKPKPTDNTISTPIRRGSVCHVEQRLQERHERNQERLERLEREERKNKRRISVDHEKNNNINYEKSKIKHSPTLSVTKERPRSLTPTRRKSKKESPLGSDVSQASSLESVSTSDKSSLSDFSEKGSSIPDLKIETLAEDDKNNNILNSKPDEGIEADEAYVSLEETTRDCFLTRSKSTESASSGESDKTVIDAKTVDSKSTSSSDEEPNNEVLSVSEKIYSFEKGLIGDLKRSKPKISLFLNDQCLCESKELPVITEESSSPSHSFTPPSFRRSVSNTSDFGSLISDSSEGSIDKENSVISDSSGGNQSPDLKYRSRSFSSCYSPLQQNNLSRSKSNSFNFDVLENDAARPWGTVCSGSVARAFEKFNIKPVERKFSSPGVSPIEERSFSQIRSFRT